MGKQLARVAVGTLVLLTALGCTYDAADAGVLDATTGIHHCHRHANHQMDVVQVRGRAHEPHHEVMHRSVVEVATVAIHPWRAETRSFALTSRQPWKPVVLVARSRPAHAP